MSPRPRSPAWSPPPGQVMPQRSSPRSREQHRRHSGRRWPSHRPSAIWRLCACSWSAALAARQAWPTRLSSSHSTKQQ
eukprot:3708667-Heterocapsa_arctica.AAC.1